MAGGASPNPYGANVPEYAGQYGNSADFGTPNAAYAAPGMSADAPYNDEFGWGPKLEIQQQSTPDAQRVQRAKGFWFFPRGHEEEPGPFYESRDADDKARHGAEYQDTDGHTVQKSWKAVGRNNPRETPPPETRATSNMSPHSYTFMRPFDQMNRNYANVSIGSARQFNGQHFSMADHRREYPILGIKPNHHRRNTYRLDPSPWDADLVDVPESQQMEDVQPQARIISGNVPFPSRSFRL
jgi:hypothetical protein